MTQLDTNIDKKGSNIKNNSFTLRGKRCYFFKSLEKLLCKTLKKYGHYLLYFRKLTHNIYIFIITRSSCVWVNFTEVTEVKVYWLFRHLELLLVEAANGVTPAIQGLNICSGVITPRILGGVFTPRILGGGIYPQDSRVGGK